MRKRLIRKALGIACSLAISAVLSSCLVSREPPQKLDIQGVKLVVWDVLQPEFPGSPNYSEEVNRVIDGFCLETGVQVELKYAERREILEVLSGASPPTCPDLVFSGEWPVVCEDLEDVGGLVDAASFVDPASVYWTMEGRLLGIPACIHWIGTAVRKGSITEGAQKTGYWTDSPAFLRAVLDCPETDWNEDTVVRYAQWVRETYGALSEDPLLSWQYGEVDSLCPVTPYLFKWLKVSTEEETLVSIVPSRSPFRDASFYYTVPAYLVLTGEGAEQVAAVELGKRLAANHGRWAARTLGCVPALSGDMPIFNLESGFGYEERQVIWRSVGAGQDTAPDVAAYLQTISLSSALAEPLTQYFMGEETVESLEESIRGAFGRHTKP